MRTSRTFHVVYLCLCALCFFVGVTLDAQRDSDRDADGLEPRFLAATDFVQGVAPNQMPIEAKAAPIQGGGNKATVANASIGVGSDAAPSPENVDEGAVSENEKFNSVDYLLAKVGLPPHVGEIHPRGKDAVNPINLGEIENRLLLSEFKEDERMDLIVNYLNNFDREISTDFFPQLLNQSLRRSEQEQINALILVGDSFYDERSQTQADFRQAKIDHLAQFANNQNEKVREALILSLAGAPDTERFVKALANQYRSDPSERVRAAAAEAEKQLESPNGRPPVE